MAKNDVGVVTTLEALSPSDKYALKKVVKRARVRAGVSEAKEKVYNLYTLFGKRLKAC